MVFHGGGGFDYNTLYNFPIWLRNFTFRSLEEHFEKDRKAYEKAQGKQKLGDDTPRGPNIKTPSYTTKVRK